MARSGKPWLAGDGPVSGGGATAGAAGTAGTITIGASASDTVLFTTVAPAAGNAVATLAFVGGVLSFDADGFDGAEAAVEIATFTQAAGVGSVAAGDITLS